MIPELMATRERVAWIFHEKARNHHCLRRRRAHTAASPRPPSTRANSGAIGTTSPVSESELPSPVAPGASGTARASGVSGLSGVSGPYFPRGSCQKSGGFHQLGKRTREERALPESCGVADLALCLRPLAAAKCEWREAPGESPPGASR